MKMKMNTIWSVVAGLTGRKRLRDVESVNVNIRQAEDEHHKRRKRMSRDVASVVVVETVQCEIRDRMLALLEDDKVKTVGVYGMGGIGKTTLSKQLYNRVSESKALTSEMGGVAWISVGSLCTTYDLQHRIAESIGLDLQYDKDLNRRAASLYAFLDRFSCCILFLDDLWGDFHLEQVGIPKQCKLILISRSLDVCRALGCQEVVKVDPLSQVEAWHLFYRAVGDAMLNSTKEIIQKANRMCDLCGGVPLAILGLANGMRDSVVDSGWSKAGDSIYQVPMGNTYLGDTFNSLKRSYDSLSNVKLKTCILYCASYPRGDAINKEELIRLWIGEMLIDNVEPLQAQYDMGHSILNKLVNSSLLETSGDDSSVKIHELTKYMALSIGWDTFMETTRLSLTRNYPVKIECWQNLKLLSLIKLEGFITFDTSPNCPSLSALLLQHSSLYELPDAFFKHMISLRVLNLSHTRISRLPGSVSDLRELQVLDVSYCPKLREVPSVAKLTKLQYLNLSETAITQPPHGVDMLEMLREPHLCSNFGQQKFPHGRCVAEK